jgi:hypothetical protein
VHDSEAARYEELERRTALAWHVLVWAMCHTGLADKLGVGFHSDGLSVKNISEDNHRVIGCRGGFTSPGSTQTRWAAASAV